MILLTSVPPVLRGLAFSEVDANSLQRQAIASWISANLHIISIHTEAELIRFPGHQQALRACNIEVLRVPPSSARFPNYLPNLKQSILSLLGCHDFHFLAITNADIIFSDPVHVNNVVSNLGNSEFLISHRLDVTSTSVPISCGNTYCRGFDFFAISSHCLTQSIKFIPSILTFGLPWWDLYLPLSFLAAGANLRLDSPNNYLHVIHDERWSADFWYEIGTDADLEFMKTLRNHSYSSSTFLWPSLRKKIIVSNLLRDSFPLKAKLHLKHLLRTKRFHPLYLFDIAEAAFKCVLTDEASASNE